MKKSTTFKIADCCLNCTHRTGRIDANVLCGLHRRKSDNNVGWMPDRGWCSDYELTANKSILRGELKLIEKMADYIEEQEAKCKTDQ